MFRQCFVGLAALLLSVSSAYAQRPMTARGLVGTGGPAYSASDACPETGPNWTIEGFAAATVGGCASGRSVLAVNTLNDVSDSSATTAAQLASSPGPDGLISFREATEQVSGARLVRSSVSGNMQIDSALQITNGNVTVDFGDAPNMGVQIINGGTTDGEIVVRASEVIFRYVRFRGGTPTGVDPDAVRVVGPPSVAISNIVFDHCSFSWGDDGNLDINARVSNLTVGWSISYQNLGPGHMLISTGGSGCGTGTEAPTNTSIHHNLFSQGSRNPEIDGGDHDIVNNVVYRNGGGFLNFETLSYSVPWEGPTPNINWDRNYFRPGATENLGGKQLTLFDNNSCSAPYDNWVSGNIGPARPNDGLPQLDIADVQAGDPSTQGTRFNYPAINSATSAAQAYNDVLTAGATKPCRDPLDTQAVAEVQSQTGSWLEEGGWSSSMYPNLNQACPATTQPRGISVRSALVLRPQVF